MQKKYFPLLLPTVLSGCAGYGTQPPVTPALVFIDGQISESTAILAQTQQRLSPPVIAPAPAARAQDAPGAMPAAVPPAAKPQVSTSAPEQPHRLSRLVMTGTAPAVRAHLLPVARNRTVSQWVKQLLPDGWQLRQENAASPALSTKLASWTVNDQWPHALNRLLAEQHLWGHLDWQNRTLTITTSSVPPAQAEAPATPAPVAQTKTPAPVSPEPAGAPRNPFTGSTGPSTSQVTAPPAPTGQTWTAAKGSTLRKTLNSWALQATCPLPGEKWQVRWQASVDYPIDALFSVSGTWKQALAETFDLYSQARAPLNATVYMAQCLIEVKDRA